MLLTAEALGGMAGQIMQTAWSRLERQGRVVRLEPPSTTLTPFRRNGDGHEIRLSDVAVGRTPADDPGAGVLASAV